MNATNAHRPLGPSFATLQGLCAALIAIGACSARLSAQTAACAAVGSKDVASVVGAAPMKTSASGCSWRGDANHYVLILENTPKSKRMPVEAIFGAARNAASRTGTVTDEAGLGDKAFLSISSSGVAALQMMKSDRLLQVQLFVGTTPSAANLASIRAIAAKAIAKLAPG